MKRAYAILLRLYPADHRALFADEMLTVFEEVADERRRQGLSVFVRFALAELAGLASEAGAERVAKHAYDLYRSANLVRPNYLLADWMAKLIYMVGRSNSSFRGRCAPDPRMLRPAGESWESWYGARTHRPEDRA